MTYRNRRHPIFRSRTYLLAAALLATGAAAHEPEGTSVRSDDVSYGAAMAARGAAVPPMARHFMRAMADRLELSAEQRDAIRDLLERERPRMQALREEQVANRQRLLDTPIDDVAYDSVVQEVAEANGRLTAERIRGLGQLRAETYALLTPDQRARARVIRDELRLELEHRRFHGPDYLF
jgi:Spy/CpxP family protein refolding chaperone